MGFLKGIRLSNFLDRVEEWHALIQGIASVVCPFPCKYKPSKQLQEEIESEHHYYKFGRVLGIIFWIVVIKAVF